MFFIILIRLRCDSQFLSRIIFLYFFTVLSRSDIDQDAYKYFMKAHKNSLHGAKIDGETQKVTPRGTITPPTSVSPISVTSPAQGVSLPPNAETFQWKWKERSKVCCQNIVSTLHNSVYILC